jgi:hypothetical protein
MKLIVRRVLIGWFAVLYPLSLLGCQKYRLRTGFRRSTHTEELSAAFGPGINTDAKGYLTMESSNENQSAYS